MKTLKEIKDEYAIELGYLNFDDITGSRSVFIIEGVMDEVAKRYAIEVAKETQRRCAESADLEYYDDPDHGGYGAARKFVRVDKESILSETNIPELI